MKKIYQILVIAFLMFSASFCLNIIYAKDNNTTLDDPPDTSLNSIIKGGSSWFKKAQQGGVDKNTDIGGIITDILGKKGSGGLLDGIFQVGNVCFICITILLGIKYAFSSIEGKADVKEGLLTLSIGAVFFYLAQSIYNFTKSIFNGFATATSMTTITNRIVATVTSVANMCAIMAIVIVGLKYMFTSADERAELKQRMLPLVIGLGLIYASAQILTFIVDVVGQLL